jgi:hypothetical protein
MISSERYLNPNGAPPQLVAFGFFTFDSDNKPLFTLPPNSFITQVTIYGNVFTVDGVPAAEGLGQFLTLGILQDPDRFLAQDGTWEGKNPVTAFFNAGDAIAGFLGTGPGLDSFLLLEESVVTGTYDVGASGINGGGPLFVVMNYIRL